VPGFTDAPGDSTSQSLSRRTGNVETDYLNGEIVRLAHRSGTSAPVNAALTRAARAAAGVGMSPGGYTAQQLADLVNRSA
jgi:2-dehydropantoate 2-reductase